MNRNEAITALVNYALEKELIEQEEKVWAVNRILEVMQADSFSWEESAKGKEAGLTEILDTLIDDAYERGVLEENSVVYRDLFDTKLMGSLTPRPVQVMKKFQQLQEESSQRATDWYYQFSQDTNYIRKDRVAKDIRWKTVTEYGEIDISINQSKPENRSSKKPTSFRLSTLHALRGECGICRTTQLSGKTESPYCTSDNQQY